MKNVILPILYMFMNIIIFGQDTIYLDENLNKINSMKRASYYKIVTYSQTSSLQVTELIYFISGQIKSQKIFSNYKDRILDGKMLEWFSDGKKRKEIDYHENKINGKILTYWENGNSKRIDEYKNDTLLVGKCFNFDGIETLHYSYFIEAKFPGGTNALVQYLAKETKYPSKLIKLGIQGRVIVNFVVNKDGSISNIKVVRSDNKKFDLEAIQVIKKMPNWSPAMEDGEAIRILCNLPINFKLE